MPHDLTLLAFALAPFLALTLLRINAAFVFLSLCLGDVLVQYVSGDINSFMRIFAARISPIGNSTMQLILLFAPAALTALFMIFSVRGRVKMLVNMLPAVTTSLFAVLLAVPLLAPGLRANIEAQSAWTQLNKAQALVVGLGAALSLLFLWSARKRQRAAEESRGHRH